MKIVNLLMTGLIMLLASLCVFAEGAKREGGDAAVVKAQMMLREVSADRDALKVEKVSMQKKIDELQKQVDNLKSEKKNLSSKISGADQAIGKYNEVNEKLRERINKDRERTQELIEKFKETVQTLKQVELQRGILETDFTQTKKELDTCANNNVELYKTNLELVELYKDKSAWDAFLQKEPITQLGRVEIENIGQTYASKIRESSFASNE